MRSSQDIQTLLAFSTQLRSFTTALQTMRPEDLTRFMRVGLDFLEVKHMARIVFVADTDGTDEISGALTPEAQVVIKAHELQLEMGKMHGAAALGFSPGWFVLHFVVAVDDSSEPPVRGGFVVDTRATVHALHSDLLLFMQNWTLAMSGLILQKRIARQNALQERMQLERMHSLANLVTGLAHKINTPLGVANTANTMLQDLARELDLTPVRDQISVLLADVKETTALLGRNIARASELMASFRQLSVSQLSDERVSMDLRELVDDCVRAVERPESIVVSVTCSEPSLPWVGYPGHLTQVLSTLIQNAVRHAYAGRDGGTIDVRLIHKKASYRIEVEDYGVGIAPEMVPRLFEPFAVWRNSSEAGLGLAVTHNIVEGLLFGKISCTSVVGSGTTFVVRFPEEVPAPKTAA